MDPEWMKGRRRPARPMSANRPRPKPAHLRDCVVCGARVPASEMRFHDGEWRCKKHDH